MTTYEIVYDYSCDEGDYEIHNIREAFQGSYEELQDYILFLRTQADCYNFSVAAIGSSEPG